MRRAAAVLTVVLILTACDRDGRVDMAADSTSRIRGFAEGRIMARDATQPMASGQAPAAASPASPASTSAERVTISSLGVTRMVIRNAEVSIRVDSLAPALDRARRVAAAVGGMIGNSWEETGDDRRRASTLELRVPSERLDQALEGLGRLGTIETVRISASDVGEEYVDTDARMRTARALESRLLQLLATRAGRLDYVLQVENELSRVREQIERFEGRMRYLREHAAWSTITATVHEPYTVVGDPGPGVVRAAFERSWENFVWLLALTIQSLGVVLPLGLATLTAWMLIRRHHGHECRHCSGRPQRPRPAPAPQNTPVPSGGHGVSTCSLQHVQP